MKHNENVIVKHPKSTINEEKEISTSHHVSQEIGRFRGISEKFKEDFRLNEHNKEEEESEDDVQLVYCQCIRMVITVRKQ